MWCSLFKSDLLDESSRVHSLHPPSVLRYLHLNVMLGLRAGTFETSRLKCTAGRYGRLLLTGNVCVDRSKCWPFVTGSIDTLRYRLGVSDFKCED